MQHVTAGIRGVGFADIGERYWIAENRQGLFELCQVGRAHQHGRVTAVTRDHDSIVFTLDAVDDL